MRLHLVKGRDIFKHELLENFKFNHFLDMIYKICFQKSSVSEAFMVICRVELTLSLKQTLSNTSAADAFRKHCGKRRYCSKRAISSFATMFSTSLSDNTLIYRDIPYFCVDVLKVV